MGRSSILRVRIFLLRYVKVGVGASKRHGFNSRIPHQKSKIYSVERETCGEQGRTKRNENLNFHFVRVKTKHRFNAARKHERSESIREYADACIGEPLFGIKHGISA